MANAPLLGPSFELNNSFSQLGSSNTVDGEQFDHARQRIFTRYISDPGLTQSSSSSPPSSPCSLTAIDSSPPSSPMLAAGRVAVDDLDLDIDMELEDATFQLNLGQAIVRCVTPELVGHERRSSARSKTRDETKGESTRLGDDLQTSPAHPFSASTRGVKRPPMYDKSVSRAKIRRKNLSFESAGSDETSLRSPQGSNINAYRKPLPMPVFGLGHGLGYDPFAALDKPNNIYARDAYLHDDRQVDERMDLESRIARRSFDPEQTLWEETIAQAVDGAESKIDLSGHNLSFIPQSISDLSNIVVFRSQTTAPAPTVNERSTSKRSMSRSTTSQVFGGSKVGTQEDEIHLFLGNNRIGFLPHELFTLDALVVLSLRHNQLTEIPPLISQLRNLRELNVANNRLKYLPSELLSMKLTSLAVDPNPFIENPNSVSKPGKERWVGPVERIHRIMPLAELSLRILIAPAEEDVLRPHSITGKVNWRKTYKSQLEELYGFPLVTELPTSIEALLALCLPGSVPSERRGADASASPLTTPMTACSSNGQGKRPQSRPCISECTSPLHRLLQAGETYQRPLFVEHAEERVTWEKEVAGQKVGGEHGVPILWRGCSAGCLDYLELCDDKEESGPSGNVANVVASEEDAWDVSVPDGSSPAPIVLHLQSEDSAAGPPFSSEGFEFDDD